jgi:hypothetical protein
MGVSLLDDGSVMGSAGDSWAMLTNGRGCGVCVGRGARGKAGRVPG